MNGYSMVLNVMMTVIAPLKEAMIKPLITVDALMVTTVIITAPVAAPQVAAPAKKAAKHLVMFATAVTQTISLSDLSADTAMAIIDLMTALETRRPREAK